MAGHFSCAKTPIRRQEGQLFCRVGIYGGTRGRAKKLLDSKDKEKSLTAFLVSSQPSPPTPRPPDKPLVIPRPNDILPPEPDATSPLTDPISTPDLGDPEFKGMKEDFLHCVLTFNHRTRSTTLCPEVVIPQIARQTVTLLFVMRHGTETQQEILTLGLDLY
ncbi:hypothetical protein DSO57_1006291 [Entomophthora muscae]|uniref:Uncharacterized protein n=1 Tax=Entomophthora muscae TaxID=34485 RepID=A0ACC2SKG8_9FUNG|nr:hypothetical protein DSO57_1006291 [Entomophthora muscae]